MLVVRGFYIVECTPICCTNTIYCVPPAQQQHNLTGIFPMRTWPFTSDLWCCLLSGVFATYITLAVVKIGSAHPLGAPHWQSGQQDMI